MICLHQLIKENRTEFERSLPGDFWERHEYQACFKIVDKSNDEPRWARKWNGTCEESLALQQVRSGQSKIVLDNAITKQYTTVNFNAGA